MRTLQGERPVAGPTTTGGSLSLPLEGRAATKRRDRASLQSRLIVRLCTVFVVFFLAAGLAVFLIYHTTSSEIPFDILADDLKELKAALTVDAGGAVSVDATKLSPGAGYLVRDTGGAVRATGGHHPEDIGATETPAEGEVMQTCRLVPDKQKETRPHYRQCSLSELLHVGGDALVLQVTRKVSASKTAIDALIYEWLGEYLPVTVPMLLALIAALVVTLHAALRPLDRLMRYARAIGPAQSGVRLPTDDLPTELLAPVEAVNGALERLDRGFQAQRDFLADAAHELRTPLAILAAHLDSMQDPARTQALRADVERMTRLVNQLLMVAQLEALTILPEDMADLSALASELGGLMAPLAVKSGRSLAVLNADHPVLVRGNRDAIYQALRNLVENALKFTPPETEVEIEVERSGSVSVSDRGPGIPEAQRALLFRRFWRADRRQSGGAGLGLAIAFRIAAAHAGELLVGDNPGGGARFTLRIPLVG
ncbi:MAG TPA: HAMP domain-containing sensor histidine kinase [Candidatus Cybelea sp.]|nr:HAMP domain-containing sensor histidine kinase [Candidatus Cybelea sp.]